MSTQTTSKPDILAKIEVYKRQEILLAKERISVEAMRKLARQALAPRDFAAAIENHLSSGRLVQTPSASPIPRNDIELLSRSACHVAKCRSTVARRTHLILNGANTPNAEFVSIKPHKRNLK